MKKCILINSATHLQRAKKLLFANNIKCYAEKSRQPSSFGCSWCIVVDGSAVAQKVFKLGIAENNKTVSAKRDSRSRNKKL